MDFVNRKQLLLSLPIATVQLATGRNLFGYYSYHQDPVAAALLSATFSVLLVAIAIFVAQDIPVGIRVLLLTGGVVLFLVQAAANVSQSYVVAQGTLPAEQLARLWRVTPGTWTVWSAVVWGGVINIVGLIYWLAIGCYYRSAWQREAMAAAVLRELWAERERR